MAHIHVYDNNPTGGGTDGNIVSENTGLDPITVGPLNATANEVSADQKLAVRCDAGYVTSGNTTITPTGTNAAKWALAPNNGGVPGAYGAYGAALTIATVIDATNTLFFAKAKATSDEPNPVNDATVDLVVAATVAEA
jgi:hypothetical protein